MKTTASPRRIPLPDLLSLVALGIGILARVARAYAGRVSLDMDQSVVALMARHMAHGTDFPLFFYGQSYMGSLEPSASALMFKLFGESGFALGLGPALFGCIALWALWRWGRDAAGPWGGLLALLGGLFGPLMHFQFQAAARGGYMVALAIEVLALLLSGRMAAALREGRPPRLPAWLALGLLAGVGLWSNLIVVPALAVSALLLAWGMHWRPWRHVPALAAAAAATLAGLSPWLCDMARRGGMDALVQGGGGHSPLSPLACILDNYRMFLDGNALPRNAGIAYAAAATALALLGALLALRGRRRATPLRNASRAAAAAFALLFAATYGFSSFATVSTGRYWIPLAPALALLAALACVLPRRRALRAAALSVWTALFALGAWLAVSGMAVASARSAALGRQIEADLAAFREAGVKEALMPVSCYWLNFASRETIAVSDGRKGFYRPNLRATELSGNPFYSTELAGLATWLRFGNAECRQVRAGEFTLLADVRCALPADEALPAVPHPAGAPDTPLDVLADRRRDTWWSGAAGGPATLEWTLPGERELTSLRLQLTHRVESGTFASATGARIEIPSADGGWTTIREVDFPSLATSLGRPYPSSAASVLEIPLGGVAASRLRATLAVPAAPGPRLPCRLAEACLFGAVPGDTADRADTLLAPDAVRAVADCIRGTPAPRAGLWFDAPRRLSGLLVTQEGIDPALLGGLPPDGFETSPAPAAAGAIPRDRVAAFCVEPRMVPATEAALRAAGRIWGMLPSGPWTVFIADAGPETPFELLWDGDAPLAFLAPGAADTLLDDALRRLAAGQPADEPIRTLARWRPEALAALPAGAVDAADPTFAGLRAARGAIPAHPFDAAFADGLRLRGVDVVPAAPRPGGAIDVTLYWQANGRPHPGGPETTFIHVCDATGRIVAQADWTGIANVPGRRDFERPLHECQPETLRIALPGNLPSGPLQLRVGRRRPGWRWRVPLSAEGPGTSVAKRALRLDGLLEIPAP